MQQPPYSAYPYASQPTATAHILPRRPFTFWLLLLGGAGLGLFLMTMLAIVAAFLVYLSSGRILLGVSVSGVRLGGLPAKDAAGQLSALTEVTLIDGKREWRVPAAQLGLSLDIPATVDRAQDYGRGNGSVLRGFFGVEVAPVATLDRAALEQGLTDLATTVNLPAQNATVRMINGQIAPMAASTGALVDVDATIKAISADVEKALADGKLDLVMQAQAPTVTDATPLIAKANALLAAPLTVNLYNPVTNERLPLTFAPAQWGTWLTTTETADGVAFTLDRNQFAPVIEAQQSQLGAGQQIKLDEVIDQAQQAIAAGSTVVNARIYNASRQYTVQSGENLWSIAWDNGIVYWRIKEANPTISNWEALSVGQAIVIPSKDVMIPRPVVEGKRIVVSISQQRMWVFDGDQVKWEWVASTGIASSPTMPGIYQVLSHDGTAYASNWNLTMPSFMSIYEAVPGFSNGIHGFPWRNGNQILWGNALGQRVTYGCILLSSANANLLYGWAEDGVIVEIKA